MRLLMLLPPKRRAILWPLLCALVRRRPKPSRMPDPLHDTFINSFAAGYALGVIHCVAAAVLMFAGAR